MNKAELVDKYETSTLTKQELGMLRRQVLTDLLKDITTNINSASEYLDKKKSKLDRKKLAKRVGFGIQPVNLRQSFKELIEEYEEKLKQAGVITEDAKTNIEVRDDNIDSFKTFLQSRLADDEYHWPRNQKGYLYRKGIWAYFLDIPLSDVKSVPSFLHNDEEICELLSDIDIKIAKEEVKSLDYDRESAIDEMSDTMSNRALSAMNQKLKAKTEEVVMLREELNALRLEMEQLKQREKAQLSSGLQAFKAGSIF